MAKCCIKPFQLMGMFCYQRGFLITEIREPQILEMCVINASSIISDIAATAEFKNTQKLTECGTETSYGDFK